MTTPEKPLSVCLTFDLDAMSVWISSLKSNSPSSISRGEFGVVGTRRILDLLRRHDLPATFFIPGHTAMAFPDLIKRIRDEGHEIGHHGWVHDIPEGLTAAKEEEFFVRGLEALAALDVVPQGYRAPSVQFSVNTIDILVKHGISYDASCSATDFEAYYLRAGDSWEIEEPYVFGKPVDIVAIPFYWGLSDFTRFEIVPGLWDTQQSPSTVYEIWREEFDYAHDYVPGGVFDLCMHPQSIGRGPRMLMLERLVEHMKASPNVLFERAGDFADRWRSEHPFESWTPYSDAASPAK
jgi:peptidoglycan/xylan/chitin deacetylase (PgdA/CDA1 family)